jgi:hypothetical protein
MSSLALHTRDTAHWRALVTAAEASVQSCLDDDLEGYLVMLLLRFATRGQKTGDHPALSSAGASEALSTEGLIDVGDRCLVIAGLMPDQAIAQGLPVRHFVDTGRYAYEEAARRTANPLFRRLADQFVVLMDVLQVMRTLDEDEIMVDLIRVYDQWQDTGSRYAYRLLLAATDALPALSFSRHRH